MIVSANAKEDIIARIFNKAPAAAARDQTATGKVS